MDQKTLTTSTDQTRIIKIMEEYQRPIEYKVVTEFLQNKIEAINIDKNDVKKFDKIPGPNFLNLTKEELCEHKLKRLNLSLESAIKLVKDLESEQKISAETVLCDHPKNVHIGEVKTKWRFEEKTLLLEAILEIYASDASSMKWSSIMRKFQGRSH
ncbi:hypothetical protein C1646_777085 [Rhizophagus diaphanus]|nr:hypothetical protein C1646_777085 [Rhizophagus diaphanus] [Rhizophagus sp. MUCL 43196]